VSPIKRLSTRNNHGTLNETHDPIQEFVLLFSEHFKRLLRQNPKTRQPSRYIGERRGEYHRQRRGFLFEVEMRF
jgi:hypothetical protein